MRVIVTGGCGFIGSHLVELLLLNGHSVCVIDDFSGGGPESLLRFQNDPRLVIHQGDVSKDGAWRELFIDADWVVHLASHIDILESLKEPRLYFEVCAQGTFNVLEASRENNIKRFVYINSGACFGIADQYPTPEDATKNPQYPYALFKLVGEEMTMHWAKVYQLPTISLRFFNLYGPRCGALFGAFIAKIRNGEPIMITGDGTQTRDFTYITDATNAIDAALVSSKTGEVYNIGSGTTVAVNRVAELLGARIEYIPRRSGEMDCTFGDISKALRDLDWSPKITIEEGVLLMKDHISRGLK